MPEGNARLWDRWVHHHLRAVNSRRQLERLGVLTPCRSVSTQAIGQKAGCVKQLSAPPFGGDSAKSKVFARRDKRLMPKGNARFWEQMSVPPLLAINSGRQLERLDVLTPCRSVSTQAICQKAGCVKQMSAPPFGGDSAKPKVFARRESG